MTWGWYDAEPVERARRAVWAVADVAAFIVESAFVGNGLFWLIVWGLLSFDWDFTVQQYGRFWTHYAKASAAARHPVEIFGLVALGLLTALAAWVRAPKAIRTWTAWPYRWPGRRSPVDRGEART